MRAQVAPRQEKPEEANMTRQNAIKWNRFNNQFTLIRSANLISTAESYDIVVARSYCTGIKTDGRVTRRYTNVSAASMKRFYAVQTEYEGIKPLRANRYYRLMSKVAA
jgi:hypothetical protein